MENTEETKIISTPAFKLKDKPHRQYMAINLKGNFGFVPDTIIVEKVKGLHDTMVVHAVVPKDYQLPTNDDTN